VETFIRNYELGRLPEIIPGRDLYRLNGYVGDQCGYFDAIELYDHCLHFEHEEGI
jgi:hypothetical protein